jgi:hypothetical protein
VYVYPYYDAKGFYVLLKKESQYGEGKKTASMFCKPITTPVPIILSQKSMGARCGKMSVDVMGGGGEKPKGENMNEKRRIRTEKIEVR